MKLQVKKAAPLKQKTPCLILGVQEGRMTTPLLKELDSALGGILQRARREGEFRGRCGETMLLHSGAMIGPTRVLLIGLGKTAEISGETLRQGAGRAVRQLRERRLGQFCLDLASFSTARTADLAVQATAEGLLLAGYSFDHYLSDDERKAAPVDEGLLLVDTRAQRDQAAAGVADAAAICAGACFARTLVNQPGNIKSPAFLAEQAQSMAAEAGLKCTVLERRQLEKEGCGALLGVAQGSCRDPRLIILEYNGGDPAQQPITLVGKGVVFDAGGISLKPADKMDEMKMDMAGGAAVLGTVKAAAALRLPVNLVGIVPAVENLPSGTAYRPGDILTSLSGKTIEVLNTDAEGRLILADALSYAARFKPRVVIDLATLTGACIIALGHHASAVLGNHDGLIKQLLAAGRRSGERLWQLPLWDDYDHQIKSEVADVKNVGGRPAGTITAAAFLQTFARDYTWAHLDIAGTAWQEKERDYLSPGGTGVGVRLLIEYLRRQASGEKK
ncbi:leucyl aminopeptidase [Geothermobacter hydrogeniphilus]|uniref:Probable cytosol aminopeptidase n=1 Tax=Geothermobacter hydrogeniphilus TaxID=1969733 RepID=A0A1X0YAM8_9BACT|nr:leucyl aminopeptidase [Geothermobacter hydrogeniphilus]ORJ62149.1 leucyl aminopeptidase [Geothermobacter hydrogeniphilus]